MDQTMTNSEWLTISVIETNSSFINVKFWEACRKMKSLFIKIFTGTSDLLCIKWSLKDATSWSGCSLGSTTCFRWHTLSRNVNRDFWSGHPSEYDSWDILIWHIKQTIQTKLTCLAKTKIIKHIKCKIAPQTTYLQNDKDGAPWGNTIVLIHVKGDGKRNFTFLS